MTQSSIAASYCSNPTLCHSDILLYPRSKSTFGIFLIKDWSDELLGKTFELLSQMDGFENLPTEIHLVILPHMSKAELKTLRCVSRTCCAVASKLLFESVSFSFDEGGLEHLEAISSKPELASHVRSLILCRKNALKECMHMPDWVSGTAYEGESFNDDFESSLREGVMSLEEWRALTNEDRTQLYQEYEADRLTGFRRMGRLASEMTLHMTPEWSRGADDSANEAGDISRFEAALGKLQHVSHFGNAPRGHPYQSIVWRRVQFALHSHDSPPYASDDQIEDLQLFVALRTIALSKKPVSSAELYLRGPGFFGAGRLCYLLDWEARQDEDQDADDPPTTNSLQLEQWLNEGLRSRQIGRRLEAATRCLVSIEQMFARITQLQVRMDTYGMNGLDIRTSAEGLAGCIRQSGNLSALTLWFNPDGWTLGRTDRWYTPEARAQPYTPAWNAEAAKTISRELLSALMESGCLPRLRELNISFTMDGEALLGVLAQTRSLRHLELRNISLLGQTVGWERVFHGIAEGLELEFVKLRGLEDVHDNCKRQLIDPDGLLTVTLDGSTPLHLRYKRRDREIEKFLLHKLAKLPSLKYAQKLRFDGIRSG